MNEKMKKKINFKIFIHITRSSITENNRTFNTHASVVFKGTKADQLNKFLTDYFPFHFPDHIAMKETGKVQKL